MLLHALQRVASIRKQNPDSFVQSAQMRDDQPACRYLSTTGVTDMAIIAVRLLGISLEGAAAASAASLCCTGTEEAAEY